MSDLERENFGDMTERILHLRSIPVAGMVPPRVLRAIAVCLRERKYDAGKTLMRQGDPIVAMQLLKEGTLSLVRNGIPIGTLEPPQTLGFLGILARGDGTYDAIAERETFALELEAEALMELLEDHSPLLQATVHYLAERLLYEMQELPAAALGIPFEETGDAPLHDLDLVERILFLRTLTALRRANLSALAAMAEPLKQVRFKPGETLWNAGDAADRTLFVVHGRVVCTAEDGRTFRYGRSTAVGGVESLARKSRWYAAVAETPLVTLQGRADDLLDLFDDNFQLAMEFVSFLAQGLVAMLARKASLGSDPLKAKRDVSKLGRVPVGA